MSGETATALVSLSRAMGRRETRIIRRGNSSTSLSLKVLNEQNLFVFLKLFCKTNFSRNMNILTIKINWWRFECKLKLLKLETIVLLFFPRKDWNFTLFLSIPRSKIKISRYNLWFESEQDPMRYKSRPPRLPSRGTIMFRAHSQLLPRYRGQSQQTTNTANNCHETTSINLCQIVLVQSVNITWKSTAYTTIRWISMGPVSSEHNDACV